ncbi:MAG: hypothetical protein ACI9RU_002461, partial [Litorivivens sp.]
QTARASSNYQDISFNHSNKISPKVLQNVGSSGNTAYKLS